MRFRWPNLLCLAVGLLSGAFGLALVASVTSFGKVGYLHSGGLQDLNILRSVAATCVAAASQETGGSAQKPNILFIMGDDIGWMQPSIYHRGLMVGETPNIDRIGREGAIFMDYVAMQSCTSRRNAFFTGMYPLRTDALPTAHGFQKYWGYLYHLDAMRQVSFPDINSSPTFEQVKKAQVGYPAE
jgi:Sulfatase